MKTQHIVIGLAVIAAIAIGYFLLFKQSSTGTTAEGSDLRAPAPTMEEVLAKGYDYDEAQQIISAIEAGKTVNW